MAQLPVNRVAVVSAVSAALTWPIGGIVAMYVWCRRTHARRHTEVVYGRSRRSAQQIRRTLLYLVLQVVVRMCQRLLKKDQFLRNPEVRVSSQFLDHWHRNAFLSSRLCFLFIFLSSLTSCLYSKLFWLPADLAPGACIIRSQKQRMRRCVHENAHAK